MYLVQDVMKYGWSAATSTILWYQMAGRILARFKWVMIKRWVTKLNNPQRQTYYHGVTQRQKRVQSVGPSLGNAGVSAGVSIGAVALPLGSGLICSPHTTKR